MRSDIAQAPVHRLPAWLPTLALAYLVFVVYGSLVPLEIRHLDLAAGWQAFLAAPFLELDLYQRQDWVANGVLYLPLAMLLAATLSPGVRASSRVAGGILGLLATAVIALGVEFTQVFFVNRTVSLNDLVAEGIGALVGVLLWIFFGRRLLSVVVRIDQGSAGAISAGIAVYLGAFVLVSVFPFDFLVSLDELRWKLSEHPPRLLPDPGECASPLHCAVKLPFTLLAALPIGVLLGLRDVGDGRRRGVAGLIAVGVCLGLAVETLQFATATGRSDSITVLATACAIPLGHLLARWLVSGGGLARCRRYGPVLLLLAVPPYLLALAWVNRLQWQLPVSVDEALRRLANTRLVPFYYHYYGPESVALASLVAAVAMYLPVGALVYAWRASGEAPKPGRQIAASFWLATALAATIWLARLFLSRFEFADPTNILIAGMAALLGLEAARVLGAWLVAASGGAVKAEASDPVSSGQRRWNAVVGFLAVGLLIVLLASHPLPQVVTPVCLLYAALLFTFPSAWLLVVPLALPAFDLGQWTGWILVEEIDLVVLTTVAVLAIRRETSTRSRPMSGVARVLIALVASSYCISFGIGLMPLSPLGADAFADLLDPWNALRILRMLLLPLLLLPFLRDALEKDPSAADKLAAGIVLGLLATSLSVAWERHLFAGVADLMTPFRIAGPFSGMHVGGQQIDAYLAGALPFVAWLVIRPVPRPARVLAVVAGTLGLYAVIVSFTRWTYLMTFASALLLLATGVLARRNAGALQRGPVVAALVLAALGAAALTVVSVSDTYMRARLGWLEHDAVIRGSHWEVVVDILDRAVPGTPFGFGLGSFPRVWRRETPSMEQSARVWHRREAGISYLRLEGGKPLYFEQRVTLPGPGTYLLRATARGGPARGELEFAICEKTVMYSRECELVGVTVEAGAEWQDFEIPIPLDAVGAPLEGSPEWVRRPVFIAAFLAPGSEVAELRLLSLLAPDGRDLVANGDFSAGRDRWRFTSDEHIVWHVKNLPLLVLFEQGWLGLLALVALSGLVLVRLAGALGKGRLEAAVLLTAFFGMWFIGLTGSVLDAPRIGMLFYLLAFWAIAHPWRRAQPGAS